MKTESQIQKPKDIYWAISIFFTSIVVGLTAIYFNNRENDSSVTKIISPIIFVSLIGFILYKIFAGKNWARITLLVLMVLGLLALPYALIIYFQSSHLSFSLVIFQVILACAAMIILYERRCDDWFEMKKQLS
jgi:CDP-diglyceride synthetase